MADESEALPAAAIERALDTQRLGRRLHCFRELDSTNTTAHELAAAGAEEGTVVIADSQRRGRGRLGRSWVSPPGRNLYASIVLRPGIASAAAPQITLVAGLAAAETAREWCPRVTIKWPNDLVCGGRKLAGILTEMVTEETQVRFVICGLGVNLNSTADDFPPDIRPTATSLLLETGAPVDRGRFTARLLHHFERHYDRFLRDGFAAIAPLWQTHSDLVGRAIVVQSPTERIEGIAVGLAADGALRVQQRDGRECLVVAGDVTVVGGYADASAAEHA